MNVTFCGHSNISYSDDMKNLLRSQIELLIKSGAKQFYLGGYGAFDGLPAHTVNDLKKKHPQIKSTLVIPYLNRKYDIVDYYDDTVYPPIEHIPYRLAIIKRNEWMIDNSDILIAYVDHTWGGAARTYAYAQRKGMEIINLYNIME